jgi:hypothetical protein
MVWPVNPWPSWSLYCQFFTRYHIICYGIRNGLLRIDNAPDTRNLHINWLKWLTFTYVLFIEFFLKNKI